MLTSTTVDKILPALLKVKAKMQGVAKESANPFFKSKYASLNAHLDEVEPLLAANGLILVQPVRVDTGSNIVSSTIFHAESGQFITSEMALLVKEQDMQKLGSAVSYARRYTLGSLLSMQAVDDDANESTGKNKGNSITANVGGSPGTGGGTITNNGGGLTGDAVTNTSTTKRASFRRNTTTAAVTAVEDDI